MDSHIQVYMPPRNSSFPDLIGLISTQMFVAGLDPVCNVNVPRSRDIQHPHSHPFLFLVLALMSCMWISLSPTTNSRIRLPVLIISLAWQNPSLSLPSLRCLGSSFPQWVDFSIWCALHYCHRLWTTILITPLEQSHVAHQF